MVEGTQGCSSCDFKIGRVPWAILVGPEGLKRILQHDTGRPKSQSLGESQAATVDLEDARGS